MARLFINPKTFQEMMERAIINGDTQVQVVPANRSDPEEPEAGSSGWCRVNAVIPPGDDTMYVKSDTAAPVLMPCRVEVMLVVGSVAMRSNAHAALETAYALAQLLGDKVHRDSPFTHQVDLFHAGYERLIGGTGAAEGADRLIHIVTITASGIIQRVA